MPLQRNTSGSPLILPTLEPPVEVLPGDTIDHPEPLAGFTVEAPKKRSSGEAKQKADATAPVGDDKEVNS